MSVQCLESTDISSYQHLRGLVITPLHLKMTSEDVWSNCIPLSSSGLDVHRAYEQVRLSNILSRLDLDRKDDRPDDPGIKSQFLWLAAPNLVDCGVKV